MTFTTLRKCLTATVALAAMAALIALSPASTAEAGNDGNPFAGSWFGSWSIVGLDIVGTFEWTISDSGRIQGAVVNTTAGVSGTTVGHVGDNGELMIVGFVPGDGFHGIPFQGTAAIDDAGKLVVSASRTDTDRSLVAILESK